MFLAYPRHIGVDVIEISSFICLLSRDQVLGLFFAGSILSWEDWLPLLKALW